VKQVLQLSKGTDSHVSNSLTQSQKKKSYVTDRAKSQLFPPPVSLWLQLAGTALQASMAAAKRVF